jgi:adenosylcobinamide kinase/adenosylcobinamide-phosphate guanylyltransferase
MSLILITGGVRAGKSTLAEQLAHKLGGDCGVCFVATAEPSDDEMRVRIAAHRASRPPGWQTIELTRGLGAALRSRMLSAHQEVRVVIVDCLTLWVSNILLAQADATDPWPAVETEVSDLIRFSVETDITTIVVSNEVGLGIVPENRLARVYCDLLGRSNQRLAAAASEVYLVVSGIPLEIKSSRRPATTPTGGCE